MKPLGTRRFAMVLAVGLAALPGCQTTPTGTPPAWTAARPPDPAFFPGVGLADKRGLTEEQCRRAADERALADLAAQIAIEIQAEFIAKVVEITAMTQEDVQSTIRTATRAHLRGHEQVAAWQDRATYWVYYRLSKARYEADLLQAMQEGLAAAEDMRAKARAEEGRAPVLALKYYLDAVEKLGDLVGQPPPRGYTGTSPLLLANTLYTSAQSLLSRFRLVPARGMAPVLAGAPLHEPLAARLDAGGPGGASVALANLPLRFVLPSGASRLTERVQTDAAGLAVCHAEAVEGRDAGRTVMVTVDLAALYPVEASDGFARRLRARLTAPQASVLLYGCADESDYRWRREFQGRRVVVLAACDLGGKLSEWTRLRDELGTFVKARGGQVVAPPAGVKPESAVAWSAAPEAAWATDAADDTLVLVGVAGGQLGKRPSATRPGAEEVQFTGEIRLAVHRGGKPHFADRFAGTGGWNPMGESMCLDVLALNVMKRWQSQYLTHLGKTP